MNVCKNCNFSFSGKFCNSCGQKASVKELTLPDLLHETWHSLTHTDSGILRLIRDLFFHPKSVYINYFSGQRKKYFSPVTFFLITAGILLFIGTKVFDYEDYKLKIFNEFGRFVFNETKFITFILLPLEVLLTWLLFYRRYNLAKNIVFWLFLYGLLFTIKILLSPLYFLFISHKTFLDNFIQIIQYIVVFFHLAIVFGNRKWMNIFVCFLITNVLLVSEYLLSGYLLFGNEIYKHTGTKNILELILNAYKS